jgi:dihydrofolate reductase
VDISIIVAAAENGTIGDAGGIPWRLPDDQKHFKALTLGHCIVMGRLTHESIGRLLPGRTTIVVSRDPSLRITGAHVAPSVAAAIERARASGESELFVVGGERIYAEALPLADRIHLTRVHAEVPGDTRFPDEAALARAGFRLIDERPHPADARHAHAFTLQRWERAAAPVDGPR